MGLMVRTRHAGHLNITKKWSQQAVKADLRDIWSKAIQKHLKVDPSEFKVGKSHGGLILRPWHTSAQAHWPFSKVTHTLLLPGCAQHYRTLVLVPDMCKRRHLRAIIEVLLDDLGFAAVLLHQESVCATFGAGVSSACVVDVGASKVSVSCVDEGISLEQCRYSCRFVWGVCAGVRLAFMLPSASQLCVPSADRFVAHWEQGDTGWGRRRRHVHAVPHAQGDQFPVQVVRPSRSPGLGDHRQDQADNLQHYRGVGLPYIIGEFPPSARGKWDPRDV